MKKWLILLMVLLMGCSSNMEEARVVIELDTVDGIFWDHEIYVPVKELKKLNIDVLENDHVAYLTTYETHDKVSNNRPYNWYVDQGDTGKHASDNCGPSASVMAAKWQDEDYEWTANEARTEFRSSGGWWYTDDIEEYFDDHEVVYDVEDYDGLYEMTMALDDGDILLLCIDTSYITMEDEEDSYIGRFYSYEGGHFLIVKGYVYIDQVLYLEVYDSNCWDNTYSDGSPKGKDRLYPAEEVEQAIVNWWDYFFIIENQ